MLNKTVVRTKGRARWLPSKFSHRVPVDAEADSRPTKTFSLCLDKTKQNAVEVPQTWEIGSCPVERFTGGRG